MTSGVTDDPSLPGVPALDRAGLLRADAAPDRGAGAGEVLAVICQADCFALPFADASFDVIVADPPYEVSNPASKHLISGSKQDNNGRKRFSEVGYIPFRGREWWAEAWRVLVPDGHLYVFAVIKELAAWYTQAQKPSDVIAWIHPNARGVQSKIHRVIGGRTLAWRPILHWRKGHLLSWKKRDGNGTHYVEPDYFIESQVQANMAEALPWPNQLPVRLLTWLLRPHTYEKQARVLDLFSGTGSVRVAAVSLGLSVVSVERSPQALAIIRSRWSQLELRELPAGAGYGVAAES